MPDQFRDKKKFPIRKLNLWGIGLSLLACGVTIFLFWYLPFDPESPPATELGMEPEFDALLENSNEKWLFLFNVDNKITESDIYGESQRVVLDIVKATHNSNSELLYDFSISPDGRLLAANYSNEREPLGDFHPPIGKIVIVDIKSGAVIDIPALLDGYKFDWGTPVYWLSPDVFLAKMHRYIGNDAVSEEVRFLRYDLRNLASFQVIEFEPCRQTTLMKHDPRVLLLASECELVNQSSVWAIDIRGKRLATSDEFIYFNHYYSDCHEDESCFQHLFHNFPTIRVESVVGNAVDGFGRWYDNNWYRDYVYLDDKIVRVSDGWIERDPVWDSDLNLLTWDESYETFQMDNQGHYRFWYDGKYIGKIPRN